MRKFSEIKWPSEYSELQRIEELLVCGICYDYMETSVMTPCSHNYCSLCIRKYLHYKNQCPACFQDTFEKDLHTNRIIDEIIVYFIKIRDKLVNCITGATKSEMCLEIINTPPVRPARSNQHQKSPEIIPKPDTPPDELLPAIETPLKSFSSPSTSGTSKLTSYFTPKSRKTDNDKSKQVPCPVCHVDISEKFINKHLDDCLKRDTMPERPPRMENKRKPLPKLVFCLMKDAELKKKMKALNLSIKGDRKALEARYHRYCTLYNAECDKVNPRSIAELLKQCDDEEELERTASDPRLSVTKLNISRNTNKNVIEAAQKQYLESNKDKFDSLIEQIRNREKAPKPPVRRSLIPEEKSLSCDEKSDDMFSPERDDSWSSRPVFEAAFQDNDSSDDDTCLLQSYTSEHPMNFLSLQINEDSQSPKKSLSTKSPVKSPPKNPTKNIGKNSIKSPKNSQNRNEKDIDLITNNDASKDTMIDDDDDGENDLMVETESAVSIFDLSTEPETDDECEVKKNSLKRPKWNSTKQLPIEKEIKTKNKEINHTNESIKNNKSKRKIDGITLAQSIADDFCEDSNDSDNKADQITDNQTKIDKENNEESMRRPLRKRNHPSRFSSTDKNLSSQPTRLASIETLREEINGNKATTDTMKRRRRRKGELEPEVEQQILPPRRPIRRREAVNVLQDSAN